MTYAEVGSSEAVAGGDGRRGRSRVNVEGIDVRQKSAHDGWYTRTHVLGRQTREMTAHQQSTTRRQLAALWENL